MKRTLRDWLLRKLQAVRWRAYRVLRLRTGRAGFRLSQEVDRITLRTGLMLNAAPTAAEVVERYVRGWVLFGVPDGRGFEWHRFENRAVITADDAHVPKRLQSIRRKLALEIRLDQDHEAIIENSRSGRYGWLTPEAAAVYRSVHDLGFISCVGAYRDGVLVAGLWGISVGGTFGIMSMFHTVDHAGAVALANLSDSVRAGAWTMVDCGVQNENFQRYGAREIPTAEFCDRIWRDLGQRQAGTGAPQPLAG